MKDNTEEKTVLDYAMILQEKAQQNNDQTTVKICQNIINLIKAKRIKLANNDFQNQQQNQQGF